MLAEIDFGGYRPDAAAGAGVELDGVSLGDLAVTAKKKGRLLAADGDAVSFRLSRRSPTASRGALQITVTGEDAEVDGDTELTVSFTTGPFTAAGSIRLDEKARFDLEKGTGVRVDPDVVPTKLKLKLGGLESDRLQLGASFEPRPRPADPPDALVTVGDTRLIFPSVSAEPDTRRARHTYRLEDTPQATLVVDYDKGTIKLNARRLELGDYAPNKPTLLDISIGELRWRDEPVLELTGSRASL